MDNPAVVAAIISAVVSGPVGALAAFAALHWRSQRKPVELEQTQLQEVLHRRLDGYSALWRILFTYGRNWILEGKVRDVNWAQEFLSTLNACNADWGVFFSEPVHERFQEFRRVLWEINTDLVNGSKVARERFNNLEAMAIGAPNKPGLGAFLKADIGSARPTVLGRLRAPIRPNRRRS